MSINDLKEITTLGLRPGNFKGTKNEDPEKFVKKFDRLAAYGGWDEAKKLQVFPLLLDDKAFDFYEASSQDTKTNYDALKKAFIAHFEPNKSNLVLWNELKAVTMSADQTIAEYHDELKKKAAKVEGVTDSHLMHVFLSGLPSDYKEHIALQEPNNLKECLQKARLFESIKGSKKEKRLAFKTLVTDSGNSETKALKEEFRVNSERIQTELKMLQETLKTMRRENEELRSQTLQVLQNVHCAIAQFPRTGNSQIEERTCFYCNIRGHLKKDCCKWKRDSQQRRLHVTVSVFTETKETQETQSIYDSHRFSEW